MVSQVSRLESNAFSDYVGKRAIAEVGLEIAFSIYVLRALFLLVRVLPWEYVSTLSSRLMLAYYVYYIQQISYLLGNDTG